MLERRTPVYIHKKEWKRVNKSLNNTLIIVGIEDADSV